MEKRSIEPINVRLWLLLVTSFTLLILTIYVSPAEAQRSVPTLSVEVEGGPLWQSYNDIEVPNDGSATRFSFVDQAGHGPWAAGRLYRSEEHTSELQSRGQLVCRLLLEKKKTQ